MSLQGSIRPGRLGVPFQGPAGYEPAGLKTFPSTEADWNCAGQCFRLFSIGIGPSSSHTVGPMRAAGRFVAHLDSDGLLAHTTRVRSESCSARSARPAMVTAATTRCSGVWRARTETVDIDGGPLRAHEVRRTGQLRLNGTHPVLFDPEDDLILWRRRSLPFHPNGMTFTAYRDGKVLSERTYYSIGGGFVLDDDESGHPQLLPDPTPVPYPFRTGGAAGLCNDQNLSISQVMLANECVRRGRDSYWPPQDLVGHAGASSADALEVLPAASSTTPGRRAAPRLIEDPGGRQNDPLAAMDWVTLWALAVNEENASGGRVVTAPTGPPASSRLSCTMRSHLFPAPTTTPSSTSCSSRAP